MTSFVRIAVCLNRRLFKSTFVRINVCSNQCLFESTFVQIDVCSNWHLFESMFVWIDVCSNRRLFKLMFVHIDVCSNWCLFESTFVWIDVCSNQRLFERFEKNTVMITISQWCLRGIRTFLKTKQFFQFIQILRFWWPTSHSQAYNEEFSPKIEEFVEKIRWKNLFKW